MQISNSVWKYVSILVVSSPLFLHKWKRFTKQFVFIFKTLTSIIEFFMVTHNAIPSGPGGVPVWMINASIMESMDCSDQNTEPKMFGSTKKAYEAFCCVPGCSNQRGNDKINGWKRSYYRFPKDPKQASVWMKMIRRDHWEPKNHDRICSDHFEGGISIF